MKWKTQIHGGPINQCLKYMKITTVSETSSKMFDAKVNQLLQQGWELHGPPTTQTVAEQHQWDGGDINSHAITTYTQVLKTNNAFLEPT
jgi:hypothetical protein